MTLEAAKQAWPHAEAVAREGRRAQLRRIADLEAQLHDSERRALYLGHVIDYLSSGNSDWEVTEGHRWAARKMREQS